MGFNHKKGGIPNWIKERAKEMVDKDGGMAYHYACYDCAFNDGEQAVNMDYPLIDCIVKELKIRRIWQ